MRVTIDGDRLKLSTYRECEPERWNSQAIRARSTKEDFQELNAYLNSMQAKVYEVHQGLIDRNEPVTIENLKDILRSVPENTEQTFEIFQHHNDQVAQLVSKEYSKVTFTRYKTALEQTRSLLAWKCGVLDMPITKLNLEFIS